MTTTPVELEVEDGKPSVYIVSCDYPVFRAEYGVNEVFPTLEAAKTFCEKYAAVRVRCGQIADTPRQWTEWPAGRGPWVYGQGGMFSETTQFVMWVTRRPFGGFDVENRVPEPGE